MKNISSMKNLVQEMLLRSRGKQAKIVTKEESEGNASQKQRQAIERFQPYKQHLQATLYKKHYKKAEIVIEEQIGKEITSFNCAFMFDIILNGEYHAIAR